MTTAVGTVTSLFQAGLMLDVEPVIKFLDPMDVPLQGGMGASGETVLATDTADSWKIDWLDETSLSPRTILSAQAVTADTVITVRTGDRLRFQTDDILLINAEYVRVTGYGTTADTLLVSRAYGGSTAATATTSSDVVGVGMAALEGNDANAARAIDRVTRFNYSQIFQATVQVSGTSNAIRKYGLQTTEFNHQLARRIAEKAVEFEQALIYGVRAIDTNTQRRSMGGMIGYITTNVNTATTSLTEGTLLDMMQTTFDAGGNPNRVMAGSKQKRVMSAFTSSGTIDVARADGQRGLKVDTYISDFGQALLVLNRHMRVRDLLVFDREQATIKTLRAAQYQPLAKTGDSERGLVVMEKSLMFERERHAGRFINLT